MDQNLEKKSLLEYLKSNLKIIISIIFLILLIGISILWLDYNKKNQRVKNSENYINAKVLIKNKEYESSLKILEEIIFKNDKIYSPLSLFLIIDQELVKDEKIVIKYFDEILSINDLEKEDLNLLKLKKAIFISENAGEKDLLDLLNPIINSGSVWKTQSIYFLGDYFFQKKSFIKSRQYYSDLLNMDNLSVDTNEIKRRIKLIDDK